MKRRIGSFFLLVGIIFLVIFAASVLAGTGRYDLTAFLVGAGSFGLGWHWQFAKRKPGAQQPAGAPAGPPPAPPKRGPLAGLRRKPAKTGPPPGGPPPGPAGGKGKGKKK